MTPPEPRPLYNQPGMLSATQVVLVEGEKCAQALIDTGIVATTAMHGANALVAAQRIGRICRTVEIAPEYVDVAVRRFQQNHPDVPVTLLATGQSFDEVAAERLAATEVAA